MITSFAVIEEHFEHLRINIDSFIHAVCINITFDEYIMSIIIHRVMLYLQEGQIRRFS